MKRLILEPRAIGHLADARTWYAAHSPGAEIRFDRAIDRCCAKIEAYPSSFLTIAKYDVQRALVDTFPYAIFFREYDDLVSVAAVLHLRRDLETGLSG